LTGKALYKAKKRTSQNREEYKRRTP